MTTHIEATRIPPVKIGGQVERALINFGVWPAYQIYPDRCSADEMQQACGTICGDATPWPPVPEPPDQKPDETLEEWLDHTVVLHSTVSLAKQDSHGGNVILDIVMQDDSKVAGLVQELRCCGYLCSTMHLKDDEEAA